MILEKEAQKASSLQGAGIELDGIATEPNSSVRGLYGSVQEVRILYVAVLGPSRSRFDGIVPRIAVQAHGYDCFAQLDLQKRRL